MYWSGHCWLVVANIFHMASAPKTSAYTPSTTTPILEKKAVGPRLGLFVHSSHFVGRSRDKGSTEVQRILALLGVLSLLSITGLEAKTTPVVIADIDGERPTLSEGSDPARRSSWGDITIPMF
jgi:hypothetical protein